MTKTLLSFPWEVLGMDEKKRLEWAFNRFYEYGRKRAKYITRKHDLSEIEASSLIPSGLMAKCLELYEASKNNGNMYNALIVDCVARVFGIVKASLARLNYNKCGVYSREHMSTGSKLIEKPDLSGGKQIDVIDILEQWDNRSSRTEQQIRNAIYSLNCKGVYINSDNMNNMNKEERAQVIKELARASIKVTEIANLSGRYDTPEEYLVNKCNMATLDSRIKNILLSREEISDSNKKYLRRWKRRNGCSGVRVEDLREYFLM